ncbi:iron-containing redox enzyme family protein [Archangium sp.]|uniref:iron-containing redox enzyme family protein n=1 Tax=Archangium sp. TaxID=1872627 RepID=UPI002D42B983|nr:iron-containing redox enzyme family protein [Archangium sp.]HYO56006.1 iron-containing redox enzyme family protein [Archangium sp.]
MKLPWLEEAVIRHPGIDNPFLAHLSKKEKDLQNALKLVRCWGEQEMPISLGLSTRWLPTVLGRLWSSAFFERHSPTRVPLEFNSLIEQSHGLIYNMAEEFGEKDYRKAHPMLLYTLLRELGTAPEKWVAFPETDELVRAGTKICEKGSLAECIGYLWGAEKFAELEFTSILGSLQRLGAPEHLLVYWKVNVGADQEHSEALGRLVDQYVAGLSADERKPVVAAARNFFEHKESFFKAIARATGVAA